MLDRIDIYLWVEPVSYDDLSLKSQGEPSEMIRKRVIAVRNLTQERLAQWSIFCNGQMSHKQVLKTCCLTVSAQKLLKGAFQKLELSARGYDRILKVARTIADLDQEEQITDRHIAEAIQFRNPLFKA